MCKAQIYNNKHKKHFKRETIGGGECRPPTGGSFREGGGVWV